MAEYQFRVVYTPAEEGGCVVSCPALPGLVTEGDTLEEARSMARDAIEGFIGNLWTDGRPSPSVQAALMEDAGVEIGRIALAVGTVIPSHQPKRIKVHSGAVALRSPKTIGPVLLMPTRPSSAEIASKYRVSSNPLLRKLIGSPSTGKTQNH